MNSADFVLFELPSAPGHAFKVLGFGRNETVDGGISFEFGPADAERAVAAQKWRGIDFLVDFEHQSIAHLAGFEQFKSPDGKAPAAGWAQLEVRGDGLYAADVQWTAEAAAAIKSGAYRYFSPVIIWGRDGRVKAIQSVGLTNEPRLRNIPPLAARRDLAREVDAEILVCKAGAALPERLALHQRISAYRVRHRVEYLVALAAVTAVDPVTAFKAQNPVESERLALHARVLEHQQRHVDLDYLAAVLAVTSEHT